MGCGCGGGAKRNVQMPKSENIAQVTANLHPNAEMVQNIQKLAEERRKVERLKREQLLKALAKP